MIHFDFRGEYPESSSSSFRRSRNYRGPFAMTGSFTTFETQCLVAKDRLSRYLNLSTAGGTNFKSSVCASKGEKIPWRGTIFKRLWIPSSPCYPCFEQSANIFPRGLRKKIYINRIYICCAFFSLFYAINYKMRRNNGLEIVSLSFLNVDRFFSSRFK